MGLPVSVTRAQVRGQAEHETTGRGGDCGGPESRRPSKEGTSPPCWILPGAHCAQMSQFFKGSQINPDSYENSRTNRACGRAAFHRAPSQAHSRRFSVFSRPIPHIHHSSPHGRRSLVPTLAPGREPRLKCSCTPRPPNPRSTRRSHLCLP